MDGEKTTPRMGYTRIETERAGRRACAKARATTGTALVKHYALRYAFPKIKIVWGPHCTNSGGRDGRTTARTWREDSEGLNRLCPSPTLQAETRKNGIRCGLTNEEKRSNKTIFSFPKKIFAE